jgi:hypothetical protein
MNKNLIKILGLASVLWISGVLNAEFRTPFIFGRFGQANYHSKFAKEDDSGWGLDLWTTGYSRNARDTFKDTHGMSTESLAGILFGKESFRLEEANESGIMLAASTVDASKNLYTNNPWIRVSTIKPKIDYYEKGFMFGLNIGNTCSEGKFHYGLRANIPLRSIEVENDLINYGEILEDVYRIRTEDDDTFWVARFDYLDAVFNNSKKAFGYDSTLRVMKLIGQANTFGVYGTQDGVYPSSKEALSSTAASLTNELSSDGTLAAGAKASFAANVNYTSVVDPTTGAVGAVSDLGKNRSVQKKLFVFKHNDEATATIKTGLDKVAANVDVSVKSFLDRQNISFGTQRKVGIGDTDAMLYFGYEFTDNLYGELILGGKIPTAKKNETPYELLLPTLGNNGHFELMVGSQWRIDIAKWLNLDFDGSFNLALNATEKRAPAFKNALIKNICDPDSVVDAKINWYYLNGNAKLTFFHPDNECLGGTVGYGFYYKAKDKVAFADKTVEYGKNFLDAGTDTTYNLSNDVLALRTNQISHKVKFEIFNYFEQFELFLGGAQTIAGKNAPKDSDWHLGIRVEF